MEKSTADRSLEELVAERYHLAAESDRIQRRLALLTEIINARMESLPDRVPRKHQPMSPLPLRKTGRM